MIALPQVSTSLLTLARPYPEMVCDYMIQIVATLRRTREVRWQMVGGCPMGLVETVTNRKVPRVAILKATIRSPYGGFGSRCWCCHCLS